MSNIVLDKEKTQRAIVKAMIMLLKTGPGTEWEATCEDTFRSLGEVLRQTDPEEASRFPTNNLFAKHLYKKLGIAGSSVFLNKPS